MGFLCLVSSLTTWSHLVMPIESSKVRNPSAFVASTLSKAFIAQCAWHMHHVPLVLQFHIKLAQAPAPPASGSAACGALCLYVTFIFRESCEMKRWQEKWTLCDLAVLQLDDGHLLKECARNASTSSTTAKGPGGHGRYPVTFLHAIIIINYIIALVPLGQPNRVSQSWW